jgi:predicted nuclease of predicted toxin-antitoxin system
MARLYANENFPLPVVACLRERGSDVLTSQEAGNAGRSVPDLEVLQFAIANQRAVLTLNRRHFVRLHNEHPQHFGIVVCSYDSDFVALATRIDEAFTAGTNLEGQLIRINRPAK